ncbi:hypothetical protein GCM10010833_08600 [Blastomonas aquatica]|uniref:Uncharacterized protein n=2 Tax=Blastomonas aquatica TaxID=1510276 RepID=A0ABQ1J2F2_9SPHN|nr:hypothetical protein GCM10010833_08600 [Blastomonas aquatica]
MLAGLLTLACLGTAQASSLEDSMTPSPALPTDQPVTLIVQQNGPLVEAKVVSTSSCACPGRFRIESESGSSNRTANTSSFSAIGAAGNVMSNIRFGGSDEWSVKLTVSIDGREDYTILRSSAEGQ